MPDHGRPCVLLVDDEKPFLEVVSELLEGEGYGVMTACDGLRALDLVSHSERVPDVILCDVMLPRLGGERIAAELRRRFPHYRLPIVLLSASADPRVHLRDVWFMPKPIDFGELLGLLERLVSQPRHVSLAAS